MKRVFVVLFAGLFMAQGFAYAMDCPGQCKIQDKRCEKMMKGLNLTAEQKEKVAAVFKECGEKCRVEIEKIRETMRQETDTKIKAILTPEQAQKYDAQVAERREKMEKRREHRQHKGRQCDTEAK